MRRLAFLHQKGGTGKTTLAIGAAMALAARGERVLLLDLDPQGTAAAWGERFAEQHGVLVRAQGPADFTRVFACLERELDWCLIDCPPTLGGAMLQTLEVAEGLLIPVRPSLPDIWAVEDVATLIRDRQARGRAIAHSVVFNQVRDEDLAPLAAAVESLGLSVAATQIPADPAWLRLFRGEALPAHLGTGLLALLAVNGPL
jgi:chromosome partitioning protein